jgi:hypothetical protein
MFKNGKVQMIAMLAVGSLLGFVAGSGKLDVFRNANAAPSPSSEAARESIPDQAAAATCCSEGAIKGELIAMADVKAPQAAADLQAPAAQQVAGLAAAGGAGQAQTQRRARAGDGAKPNILFIMGDDIGWMQPSCYHRGLMVGETPNIDRIANEGAIFMDYVAMQSCTSGRNAFITGMYPLRTGMIPPQLPGSPSYLRPGTPCLAKFLLDLGYTTGQFGKNHLELIRAKGT